MYIPENLRRTIYGSGYLNGSEILAFDTLITYANHNGVTCITLETISEQCQRTVRTVKKYIKSLVNKGVITEKEPYYELNLNVNFWKDKAKTFLEEHPEYIKTLNNLDISQFSNDQEKAAAGAGENMSDQEYWRERAAKI